MLLQNSPNHHEYFQVIDKKLTQNYRLNRVLIHKKQKKEPFIMNKLLACACLVLLLAAPLAMQAGTQTDQNALTYTETPVAPAKKVSKKAAKKQKPKKTSAKKTRAKKSKKACGGAVSECACSLRRAMAKLWSDHVFWTRLYIIAALDNNADLTATTNRLLQNQADIGNAVASYYGKPAGDALTKLLKDHILIAAEVVKAAKAGTQDQLTIENAKWYKNADDIAAFLHKANPINWSVMDLQHMLHEHLKLTTDEVVARLQAQWDHDVQNFENILSQALSMGQTLANGIIKQFPGKF